MRIQIMFYRGPNGIGSVHKLCKRAAYVLVQHMLSVKETPGGQHQKCGNIKRSMSG